MSIEQGLLSQQGQQGLEILIAYYKRNKGIYVYAKPFSASSHNMLKATSFSVRVSTGGKSACTFLFFFLHLFFFLENTHTSCEKVQYHCLRLFCLLFSKWLGKLLLSFYCLKTLYCKAFLHIGWDHPLVWSHTTLFVSDAFTKYYHNHVNEL